MPSNAPVYEIDCPDCSWTSPEFDDYAGELAAKVDAAMHYVDEHGGEIPDDADFGEHQCPSCHAILGMNGTVSCSECGYIPEEHRLAADGGRIEGVPESRQIELTERQRERFDQIKADCKEADPHCPEPSDSDVLDSLLDTWDAVGDGLYADDDRQQEEAVSLGDERQCPDCGGRQVVQSVGLTAGRCFVKTGEEWICTDSECDRRDPVEDGGSDD